MLNILELCMMAFGSGALTSGVLVFVEVAMDVDSSEAFTATFTFLVLGAICALISEKEMREYGLEEKEI